MLTVIIYEKFLFVGDSNAIQYIFCDPFNKEYVEVGLGLGIFGINSPNSICGFY